MDLAIAANIPEEVTLGGKPYRVRLLTIRERGQLQAYLKTKLQSPITRTAIAIQQAREAGTQLDKDIENRMHDRAEAAAMAWPPRFGSQAWFEAIDGIEGGWEQVLYEVVSKTEPSFALEDAEKLAPRIKGEEWFELGRVAFWGTPPAPKGGGADGASPTPSSPNGTTGTGSSASSTTSTTSTPSGSST